MRVWNYLIRTVGPQLGIFLAALAIAYQGQVFWVSATSDLCIPPPRSVSTELISLYDLFDTMRDNVAQLSKDLGAVAARVYIYDDTYSVQHQIVGSVDPRSSQDRFAFTEDPIAGEFVETQLDAHQHTFTNGGCYTQEIKDLGESPLKRKAESQNTSLITSCPLYTARNFLVGFVQLSFEGEDFIYTEVAIERRMRFEAQQLQTQLDNYFG